MIARTESGSSKQNTPTCHQAFVGMLPAIRKYARIAFRNLDPEAREEAVQEVVANAFVAYRRLVEAGKTDLAFPTPLAMYGVRQFRAGRRVGAQSNVNDISSPYAQTAKGIHVARLDHRDKDTGEWRELLLEDRRAGPAETAAARIDFGEWLRRLPRRRRRIAEVLATGETTKKVARRFRVSSGRVSQIRRELKRCWDAFQGQSREAPAVA